MAFTMVDFANNNFIFEIIGDYAVSVKLCKGLFGNYTHYGSSVSALDNNAQQIIIPETVLYDGKEYIVKNIGKGVFDNLTLIEGIYIPKTVEKINWGFYHCYNLKFIKVESENRIYCDIDGVLYCRNAKKLVVYPNRHGAKYAIPSTVTEIGNMAFKSCKDLTDLHIPISVLKIGTNVFYECNDLKLVLLPKLLREIQEQSQVYTTTNFVYQNKMLTVNELNKSIANKLLY